MAVNKPHRPVIVTTGVMTLAESQRVDVNVQAAVDAESQRLLERHGQKCLAERRDILRRELEFAWGVNLQEETNRRTND